MVATLSFQERIDARRSAYKKTVDSDDVRRKREEETVALRKQKRETQLMKKRCSIEEENSENVPPPSNALAIVPYAEKPTGVRALIERLKTEPHDSLAIVTELRKRLSQFGSAPIKEASEAAPLLVAMLTSTDTKLLLQCAWALTNIASGTSEDTAAVLAAGAVPYLVQLLESPDTEIRSQVMWGLANIAGDSYATRDVVLAYNPVVPILNLIVELEQKKDLTMLQTSVWCLGNLCRGKPAPDLRTIAPAVPYLVRLLHHSDVEVLRDSLFCLSYITDGSSDGIDFFIQSGGVQKVVELLGVANEKIVQPAIRIAGNIASGSDVQTMNILQAGILSRVPALLASSRRQVRKETLWMLSNITGGNSVEQLQSVLDAECLPLAITLSTDGPHEVRKEALYTLGNAAHVATASQMESLVRIGCIEVFVAALKSQSDTRLTLIILDALGRILRSGKSRVEMHGGQNPYCVLMEESGAIAKIEELQEDNNEEVYQKAVGILSAYFDVEDEHDMEMQSSMHGAAAASGCEVPVPCAFDFSA
jgi:HEAT repeat protein